ncbi:hypothetical protein ES702_01572 [subsurface metagenome]
MSFTSVTSRQRQCESEVFAKSAIHCCLILLKAESRAHWSNVPLEVDLRGNHESGRKFSLSGLVSNFFNRFLVVASNDDVKDTESDQDCKGGKSR